MLQAQVSRRRRRQAGITLVEVMVALGIFGIVTATIFTYLSNITGYRDMLTVITTRDAIARRIQTQAQLFRSVAFSADDAYLGTPGNRSLRACIDEADDVCDVTSPDRQVSFRLYTNMGSAGAKLLAGTVNDPVLYDHNGRDNCSTGDLGCPSFQAVAYFWANCPNREATCKQATSIAVRYQVTVTRAGAGGRDIPAQPPEPQFTDKKTSFAVIHPIARRLLTAQSCPAYTQQTGFDDKGRIICRCLFNFTPTGLDADGHPICKATPVLCGVEQVMRGIDAVGNPICVTPIRRCAWVPFDDKSAKCPKGGWLERLDMGVCRAGAKTKKADKREIRCDKNQGYCCWNDIT